MRQCGLLVLLLSATASAGGDGRDAPQGTYSLGKDPRKAEWTVDHKTLPSCGDEAKKIVDSFKGLSIFYRGKVWVGGHAWVDDGAVKQPDGYAHFIHQPDASKRVWIRFVFWRDKDGAQAWLLFSRLDEAGEQTCHDGAVFRGTYAP